MKRIEEVSLPPEEAFDEALFTSAIFRRLNVKEDGSVLIHPLRRSIDARSRNVQVKFQVELVPTEDAESVKTVIAALPDVKDAPSVVIAGAGPAGLFAAFRLIELGIKPVIIERGKDVQTRRRDLAAINKDHTVNPDSNYCFGEGGAGTYSDGKLYTRSKKRGDVQRVLEILAAHGAPAEILYDAHPHIGTNKLPKVVSALRESILQAGGEIHFDNRLTNIVIENGAVTFIETNTGMKLPVKSLILAAGHSARDIFELLHARKILIEAKPFALGVRVEHAQWLIDSVQYHCGPDRGPYLPASSYSLVHQAAVNGGSRGVFSFCMCPGGFIVPAATAEGEIVVNGMSPSRRDSRFANSGIVVAVEGADFRKFERFGPLAGMYFQRETEQLACAAAGGRQTAPAQRLLDYCENKTSQTLLESSYQPGLVSMRMSEILPGFVADALMQGFRAFGKKIKGYLTNDAQIIGIESRTSSPVRVPRNAATLEHPEVQRLFPCGEGAGFAGGIVSAAMDGERCAEAAAKMYFNTAL